MTKGKLCQLLFCTYVQPAGLDEAAATRARAQISSAMHLLGPRAQGSTHSSTQVLQLSALKGTGLPEFWQAVCAFREAQRGSGALQMRRHEQDQAWMWERIEAGLRQRFRQHPVVQLALPAVTEQVIAGHLAASVAARRLLDLMD